MRSTPRERARQGANRVPTSQPEPVRKPNRGCARQVRTFRHPRALQLPFCVRPARRALAAGKAPYCLQRAFRRDRQLTRKLSAACTWVEKPLPRLKLLPDSLFGTCLEEVLQATPRKERQEEVPLPGETRFPTHPETVSAPHPGKVPPGFVVHPSAPPRSPVTGEQLRFPFTRLPATVPLTHPVRASLELLTRHASGPWSVSRLSTWPKSMQRSIFFGKHSERNSPRRMGSRPLPEGRTYSGWLAHLSQRLSRYLATSGRSHARRSVEPWSADLVPGWIARAASAGLAGPLAPLELLLRLLDEPGAIHKQSPARNNGLEGAAEASPRPLLQGQAERTASGAPAWDAPFSSAPRGAAPSPVLNPPTGAQQGFYPQSGSLPLPAAGQPNFRPPLAPPLTSEHAPTLLPPQGVFDAPTPFAAATARQAAKDDENRLVEEELDILASKIKRILDTEARLYGIQV